MLEEEEMRDLLEMRKRDKEFDAAIGERVQEARMAKGWSRKALAEAVGLSDGSALYKYERGQRGFNSKQLGKVALALGRSMHWLVKGEEFDKDRPAPPAYPQLVKTAVEAQEALAPLGLRLATDSSIPQPILDLLNLGWANPLTNDELLHLRVHLAMGRSPLPHDLELAVRTLRLQLDGSDENFRLLQEANRRRAEALGGKRLVESDVPPPRLPSAEAVNEAPPRPKTLGPRPRTRKRPDSSNDKS